MRAANVTGLAAQLAAELYAIGHDDRFLASAKQWYEWNWSCLRRSPGLYNNSRDDDGSVNETLWSYNSGAMIGTATTLYRATGDRDYLDRAVEDAQGSLTYWEQGDRLHDQPAIFNAFYFDNLRILNEVRPDRAYRAAATTYAERTWEENRDAVRRTVPLPALRRRRPRPGRAGRDARTVRDGADLRRPRLRPFLSLGRSRASDRPHATEQHVPAPDTSGDLSHAPPRSCPSLLVGLEHGPRHPARARGVRRG